jgi:Rod binding domain-containing protein
MSTLPPIDRSVLPAAIRNGSDADKKNFQAALGFERMLVQQLTKAMADTTKTGGDDDESSAATSTYRAMLPDALADGITASGGLGLAAQISKGLK